jgi:hypothetical protein
MPGSAGGDAQILRMVLFRRLYWPNESRLIAAAGSIVDGWTA